MLTKPGTKPQHLIRGEYAEERACQFLIEKGLKLVCRNYRCKQGEVDLIMADQCRLVIIEVRFRSTNKYGTALESITHTKQARIIATTQHYLSNQKINPPIRFDVVTLSGDNLIKWIKNAF